MTSGVGLTAFTVEADYRCFAGQELQDSVSVFPVSGSVVFTPVVDGVLSSVVGGLVLRPVQGVLEQGVLCRHHRPGVRLVANVGLGLAELSYRVSFFDVRGQDGSVFDPVQFSFVAPSAVGVVDLVAVTPAPVLG